VRILLDECLDWRLRRELPGHEVKTVQEMGWDEKGSEAVRTTHSHILMGSVPGRKIMCECVPDHPHVIVFFFFSWVLLSPCSVLPTPALTIVDILTHSHQGMRNDFKPAAFDPHFESNKSVAFQMFAARRLVPWNGFGARYKRQCGFGA
jgi:hypothetical protein